MLSLAISDAHILPKAIAAVRSSPAEGTGVPTHLIRQALDRAARTSRLPRAESIDILG